LVIRVQENENLKDMRLDGFNETEEGLNEEKRVELQENWG